MMDVQNMVIDDSFHEIEKSPAKNHRANERFGRQSDIALTNGVPQERQPDGSHHPRQYVKESVPEHIDLQVHDKLFWWDASRGVFGREHVMHLQELVQHDAIDEATHTDSQSRSGCNQGTASRIIIHVCFDVVGKVPEDGNLARFRFDVRRAGQ